MGTLQEGVDDIRNGPDYAGATIFYPVNGTPPYAGIAIVPGYCGGETDIQDWGPFYASHGIIAITIGTNDPCADWPSARATALLDAIVTVKEENTRTNSPLEGKVDVDRFAVSGWSMGGGGSQLAASIDPSLKAVIGLCPWLDLNGFQPSDLIHDVPVLIFTGQNDDIANSQEYGYMHYSGTPASTDKLYFEIASGGHDAANGPDRADGDAGIYALSWLKTYLIIDSCYCEFLLEIPLTSSAYETNIECPEMNSIDEQHNLNSKIAPNPVYGNNLLTLSPWTTSRPFFISDSSGKVYMKGTLPPSINKIDVSSLHPGTYYLNMNNDSFKFIKID